MESVVALSFACNVLQLIQFSSQTILVWKQFYHGQSPSEDVDNHCQDLRELSSKLKDSLSTFGGAGASGSGTGSTGSDQQLLSLADKLIKHADDLNIELAKFRPDPGRSKGKKLLKSVKYQWGGKNRINELHGSMKTLETTIQSLVLLELRKTTTVIHEKDFKVLEQLAQHISSDQSAGFVKTTDAIQNESVLTGSRIKDESNNIRSDLDFHFGQTRTDIASESLKLQNLIKQELGRLQDTRLQNLRRENVQHLFKSLEIPDINARYHSIAPSHGSTFEWIYPRMVPNGHSPESGTSDDDQDSDCGSIDDDQLEHYLSFSQWLSSEEKLVWISGKPGSGKSTLMKFLVKHSRTRDLLTEQQGSTLILSHFIWNAGAYDQRSLKSLIASLFHQLLSCRADVAHTLIEKDALQQKRVHSDWSQESLKSYLFEAIRCVQSPVCIFIDGLDEIDHAHDDGLGDLLQLIRQCRSLPNVRLCVSSRPEAVIRHEYKDEPTVRLQDLTRLDMRKYIQDKLSPEWEKTAFLRESDETITSITDAILDKSDGIFLWVRLVVSSICNGLVQYDNWEMLLKRIESLPSKMNELYKNMWNRLNDEKAIYRENSALYFKLLLFSWDYYASREGRVNTVLRMFVASDSSIQRSLLGGGPAISEQYLKTKCNVFQHQLLSRCAGLVEIAGQPEGTKSIDTKIQFIHKSAADFLLNTIDGHILLQYDKSTTSDLFVRLFLSVLVSDVLLLEAGFMSEVYAQIGYVCMVCSKWFERQERSASSYICCQLYLDLFKRTVHRIPEFISSTADLGYIAAEVGLFEYVSKQVREKSSPPDLAFCSWKNLLLGFACTDHDWSFDFLVGENKLKLIEWLLDEDSDPNASISHFKLADTTPFKCFLRSLASFSHLEMETKRKFMRTLCRLIEHGADVNCSLLMGHVTQGWRKFDIRRIPMFSEALVEREDGGSENEELRDEDCGLFYLFVEVPQAGSRIFKGLGARVDSNSGQDEKISELIDTVGISPLRVRLMMRLSESRYPNADSTDKIRAKIVASEDTTEAVSLDLDHAYDNNTNPEMNLRETLIWMIENGFLAEGLCDYNPRTVFRDVFSYTISHHGESIPRRKGLTGVDFSHHSEYSRLMEAASQLPKDNTGQDFIDYMRNLPNTSHYPG